MRRKLEPTNFPALKCAECQKACEPYKKFSCDNEGNIIRTHSDIWPEYFRDVITTRIEFCSAQCGLAYCTRNQLL